MEELHDSDFEYEKEDEDGNMIDLWKDPRVQRLFRCEMQKLNKKSQDLQMNKGTLFTA